MVSVRPIIAGDPSRGALSLDTEASILPGRFVQFLHLPNISETSTSGKAENSLLSTSPPFFPSPFPSRSASESQANEDLATTPNLSRHQVSKRSSASSSSANSFVSSLQGQGALAFNCEAPDQRKLLSHPALSTSFASTSEHGYVVGRPNESSWICIVQGSTGFLRL